MDLKRFGSLVVDPKMVKVASVYMEFPSEPAPAILHKATLEAAQNDRGIQDIDNNVDIEIQKREHGVVVLVDNTRIPALADDVRLLLSHLAY